MGVLRVEPDKEEAFEIVLTGGSVSLATSNIGFVNLIGRIDADGSEQESEYGVGTLGLFGY